MIYLFIGEDSFSKDAQLRQLRQEFLDKETEQFNLDILYARELSLKGLQENALFIPVKSKKRIILIREASYLKEDLQEFILSYAASPSKELLLILDITRHDSRDKFISALSRLARVFRFKEEPHLDTFTLSRQIDSRNAAYALSTLAQLLNTGEKPERIMGGLRYSWDRQRGDITLIKKKFKLLLNCDLDIKTGRLKPAFALERLVVKLCSL